MIQINEKTGTQNPGDLPICPHCKAPVESINMMELAGSLGKRYLYYCAHCRAALGISHRKGFWMG